jgi:hypothetical protein
VEVSRTSRVSVFLAAVVTLVVTAVVPFTSLIALAVLFGVRKRLDRRELQVLAGAAIIGLVLQLTWIVILYVLPIQGSTVFH